MASRVAGRLHLTKDVMVSESFAVLASDLKTVSKNVSHTIDSPSELLLVKGWPLGHVGSAGCHKLLS